MIKRKHKYNAVKTEVDGITFASKKEAKRYGELKLLERAGEITSLMVRPKFDLWMMNQHSGVTVSVGSYIGDFQYWRKCGLPAGWIVEDVKGFKMPVYRLKKKMVEAQHGIKITEI